MIKAAPYFIVNALDSKTAEIFIYDDIGNWQGEVSASLFVKELRALEKKYANINIRINCYGGSVYEGIAIFNAVKNSPCNIECYIDGIAASMAALIALACKKVHMSKYARLMIHEVSGGAWGMVKDLLAVVEEMKALNAIANQMLQKRTGLSEQAVSEQYLNAKDNYYGAEEAERLGLIDDIYDKDDDDAEATELPDIKDQGSLWAAYNERLTAKMHHQQEETLIILS